MNKSILLPLIFITFTLLNLSAVCQENISQYEYPEVTLERTQVRVFNSEIVGQEYEIYISLPMSYHYSDTLYPVIYLLDPYRAFPLVKSFMELLAYPHDAIPEIILVGIGYGGKMEEAMLNFVVGRTRDYTPETNPHTEEYFESLLTSNGTQEIDIQTGGAKQFLQFLDTELIPILETEYRVDPNDRMLAGYSFGGLFGLYALFHKPELFNKYFVGSPSIHYKNEVTFTYEREYANTHEDLEAHVFMTAGALEERTAQHVERMADTLYSRDYNGLQLETVIFPDENHITCAPAAVSRALIRLYQTGN